MGWRKLILNGSLYTDDAVFKERESKICCRNVTPKSKLFAHLEGHGINCLFDVKEKYLLLVYTCTLLIWTNCPPYFLTWSEFKS